MWAQDRGNFEIGDDRAPGAGAFEQMDAPPSRPEHRERYEEYFEELRREVKGLEERLATDEQRQAADERALRTLLAHIRDHPNSDDSCLYTDDVLKLQQRDSFGPSSFNEPPSPHDVIRDLTAKKLVYYYWGKRSVCFVTPTGATYHFAGCPALYEGEDLGHVNYSRSRPGLAGYAFGSEGEMHAWAKAKGLRPCGVARKEFHCTAVGSSY
eukprot:tig00000806_g4330.t1